MFTIARHCRIRIGSAGCRVLFTRSGPDGDTDGNGPALIASAHTRPPAAQRCDVNLCALCVRAPDSVRLVKDPLPMKLARLPSVKPAVAHRAMLEVDPCAALISPACSERRTRRTATKVDCFIGDRSIDKRALEHPFGPVAAKVAVPVVVDPGSACVQIQVASANELISRLARWLRRWPVAFDGTPGPGRLRVRGKIAPHIRVHIRHLDHMLGDWQQIRKLRPERLVPPTARGWRERRRTDPQGAKRELEQDGEHAVETAQAGLCEEDVRADAEPALMRPPYGKTRLLERARTIQLPIVFTAEAVERNPERVGAALPRRVDNVLPVRARGEWGSRRQDRVVAGAMFT